MDIEDQSWLTRIGANGLGEAYVRALVTAG
jgi:hypothetical protein